jgi:type IV pilus assembly protein PilQ
MRKSYKFMASLILSCFFESTSFSTTPTIQNENPVLEALKKTSIAEKNNFISIHLKKAFLKDFLSYISSHYNINFVFSDEIGLKTISVKFKETPLDQAINAILEIHALGMTRLSDNIIQIETIIEIQKKKEEHKQSQIASTHLIPTKISIFRLSYATADKITPVVKELLMSSSSHDPRVKVQSNEQGNSIIVEALPQDLEKVYGLIKRMDLQTPQVKIETRVIEVLKNATNSLGINWSAPLRIDKGRGVGFGNLIFPNNMLSNFSIDTGATNLPGSKFDTHFGSINNSLELDLKIRLSEINNISRSLQNNSVIVLNNQPATISAGQTDFFPISKGGTSTETVMQQVDYDLKLDVTPHITADGSVQMKIRLENSNPQNPAKNAATSKSTRIIDTSLIRKSGETAVIGGLYNVETSKVVEGVPILSKIPLLSIFFSSTTFSEDKRELIILVTPTIINTEKAFSFSEKETTDAKTKVQKNDFYETDNEERLKQAVTLNQAGKDEELLLEEINVEDSFNTENNSANNTTLNSAKSNENTENFKNDYNDILENNESFKKTDDIDEKNSEN